MVQMGEVTPGLTSGDSVGAKASRTPKSRAMAVTGPPCKAKKE